MRLAVFQFAAGEDIYANFCAIKRAILKAAEQSVRLIVFQECALCGYPPIERPDVENLDFKSVELCVGNVRELAKEHRMYVALGLVTKEGEACYNTMLVIAPSGETMGSYDKRALWGYDLRHFKKGRSAGVFEIDGVKTGFRICYEVRFPEYFRELFRARAQLCFVSFSDVAEEALPARYGIIKAHLITRAVENVMTVVSVNSVSNFQTAPTAVFDVDGYVAAEAPLGEEFLLVYDYDIPELGFGARGRLENSMEAMAEKHISAASRAE
ncbi:MAG: carbon-nitrogen hydrolase family protein [Clostridiaceae bacterium]|nr:carbon-nitrogen hydrolase family protein [Eubacteriales bacterium]